MNPYQLSKELRYVTQRAVGAIGYMPKRSKYRIWSYKLLQEQLEAWKYVKLKRRLEKFYGTEL